MTFPAIRPAMFFAAAAAAAFVTLSFAPRTFAQATPEVKRTVLLRHDIPAPGFEALLVGVEIPVGGREGRHTHPGLAIIHVEEGTIHEGINKGSTPIKVTATFVIPKGATLTTPAK